MARTRGSMTAGAVVGVADNQHAWCEPIGAGKPGTAYLDEQGNTRRESVKVGVMLTGLVPVSQIQTDLFDDRDRGKSK